MTAAAEIQKNAAGVPVRKSEFGGFEIVPPPDRELPTVDPHADRLTEADLMRQFGWSAAQLDAAKGLGLPEGHPVTTIRRFAWGSTRTAVYSRTKVAEWADRVRSLGL